LRNVGNHLTLNKKQSPSTNFTSGSIRGVQLKGPTSNLRNLAGQLLMSGSSTRIAGTSINEALLKKNQDLQGAVQEQLMLHQHLLVSNKKLEIEGKAGQ